MLVLSPRTSRGLVRLLILALVPVLLVTQGNVAQAAQVAYSGNRSVSFGYDDWVPGAYANCSASVFYKVVGGPEIGVQTVEVRNGKCDTGPAADIQSGTLKLSFQGETPAGDSCSFVTTQTLADETEDFGSASASGYPLPRTGTAEHLCNVQELHWSIFKDVPFHPNDIDESGVVSLPMGPPLIPDGSTGAKPSCGRLSGIYSPQITDLGPDGTEKTRYRVLFRASPGTDFVASESWRFYVMAWGGSIHSSSSPAFQATGTWTTVAGKPWQLEFTREFSIYTAYGDSIRGAGVILNSRPASENGLTQTTGCATYYGEKYRSVPDSDVDEPAGPINQPDTGADPTEPPPSNPDPSVPTTSTCDFSFTDPASWASGGICALVGLLGAALDMLQSLLDAVLGLADAIVGPILDALAGIVSGILDGLEPLFVPSDGFLDARFSDAQAAWEDTSAGQWLDALDGLVPGAVSGCEGLPLNVSLPGGVTVDESIGAACSGTMANVAGLVRIALSAALVVGGGMACVRALGSGFGWNPGVGRGEV